MNRFGMAALAAGALVPGLLSAPVLAQGSYDPIAVNGPPSGSGGDQVPTGLGFVLFGAGDLGGDRVATIFYDDGDTSHLDTGDGVTLGAGVHYRALGGWDFRGTVGYKYTGTEAENANLYIGRVVWQGVVDYIFPEKWFFGAGVVHHSGIRLHGDDVGPDLDFKSATGATIEAGWSFLALTYTFMDYEDEFGNQYDANNVGFMFIGRF